ncbi:MAG: ATP-binding cassette domain-containing protein [Clostridia bacterium]|nr:ATP-binding cassette domain-containing protein [Clostridia bacterium]
MDEIIKIENLKKSFGSLTVLDGVSLSIGRGEIFGVIGLSGAGKSTLIRCINRLEKPDGGRIVVDGQDLALLSPSELQRARRKMGMIFQQFNLLSQRTVLKNVRFPLELEGISRESANARARELLELVGLSDKENAYPALLSGGQQQRVAIARALATNPQVLLCDEATSALDQRTTRQILDLLQSINRRFNITIVIITHEMRVIETVCGRVAIIHESRIAEEGAVAELFKQPKTAAARELILPAANPLSAPLSNSCVRLVFDGTQTERPIVSEMVLCCGAPVNILFADTKQIEGRTFGQLLLQLPDDPQAQAAAKNYLVQNEIHFIEEVAV